MSVSVVVLNWQRPFLLRRVILPMLARNPAVDEIVVSHGRADTRFSYGSRRCSVVHRDDADLNERYGLALRFVAAEECRNEAVLLLDDDLVVARRTVQALESALHRSPTTLHGLIGRGVDSEYRYRYGRIRDGEAPVLLTRCVMMHRSYARAFLDAADGVAHLVERGVPLWNGEDIFLSLLSIRRSGALPRAYDLPFWNLGRAARVGVKTLPVPAGETGKLPHREYRAWFTREAALHLGIQKQLDDWLASAS